MYRRCWRYLAKYTRPVTVLAVRKSRALGVSVSSIYTVDLDAVEMGHTAKRRAPSTRFQSRIRSIST